MPLRLVQLRQEDVPMAAQFIIEAGEWAPRTPLFVDPGAILSAPNSVWVSALNGEELVGIGGIHSISWPDQTGEIAVGVVPKWRGRGLSKVVCSHICNYGLKDLGLTQITSTVLAGSPSQKIVEANGFKPEFTRLKARRKANQWHSTISYVLENGR